MYVNEPTCRATRNFVISDLCEIYQFELRSSRDKGAKVDLDGEGFIIAKVRETLTSD